MSPWFKTLGNFIFQTHTWIEMRFSIFGYVVVLAAVFAIPIKGLSNGQDFGSDFEKELISVGSEVESIGK